MGQRLICRKCHKGLYSYSEPDKEDWSNRMMKCEACGFEETLSQFSFGPLEQKKEKQMDKFDRDSRNTGRFIRFAGILAIILSVAGAVLTVVVIKAVIANPGAIGEFFGKIVHGFSAAAR